MTDLRLLYVTTKDIAQARAIATALLDRHLIACANVLPGMESIYRWKGVVQNELETVLILKTSAHLVKAATDAVLALHSYETPCILALQIESGASGYLNWLVNETKSGIG